MGLTCAPLLGDSAAGTRTRKPSADADQAERELHRARRLATARGVTHSQANTGAKMMMNSALSDWNQLLGKSQPNATLRVMRSANRFSVEPACSNTDQKSAAHRKKTPMT